MDVHFSKTGYPVVIHDYTLDRTTNCSGQVRAKSVRQLQKCDAGSWFSSKFEGEEIPTLYRALAYVRRASPTTQVILQMKVTPTKDDGESHRFTGHARTRMADRTIIMGSDVATMTKMGKAGAKRRAFIFGNEAGWDRKYKIMVPYDVRISGTQVRAAHKRGAKVWTVKSHPISLKSVLRLSTPVDGVMVNRMSTGVLDLLEDVL